ncbi:MAG: type IV pilus biogenesis/stability protein PilW [Pseudomonadota bacterium]
MIRWWALTAALLLLAGCVTERMGGSEPAPRSVQLQAQLDLARGYLDQRDWARAREPLKRALEIQPRSAEAHALMAVLHQNQSDPDLAEEHYRRALRYDRDFAMALNNYGSFLYAQGRYEEALRPLRRLVRDPDYRARAQAYENLGLTELKVGNRAEAERAFERALSFNAVLPRSSFELARLAFDDGRHAEARRYYEMFRGRMRQTPATLCLGLRLARQAGDSDRIASYRMALSNLHSDSPEAQRCIAED